MRNCEPMLRFHKSHTCRISLLLALVTAFCLSQSAIAQQQETTNYAQAYIRRALNRMDGSEIKMPAITRLAERMAKRHLAGGAIGFIGGYYEGSGLHAELEGRSGGLMNMGFDRVWTKERTAEQKANDMAIIAWDSGPWPNDTDLTGIKKLKETGTYIIGFGPRKAELAERIALCDDWLDTGLDTPGHLISIGKPIRLKEENRLISANRVGRGNLLVNMVHGWMLTAEFVSALTRQGKMPPLWKSFMYPDGAAWANKYFQKVQFHDDFQIAPIPAGQLGKAYLNGARENLKWYAQTQLSGVANAANLIAAESAEGRKIVVATAGHVAPMFTGKFEDTAWVSKSIEINEPDEYIKSTPNASLILRLGYTGVSSEEIAASATKKQRVIWIGSQNPNTGKSVPAGLPNFIDMGWAYGDATVSIEGYPIKILPLSGIMQIVAFETINVETLARVIKQRATKTPAEPNAPAHTAAG